MSNQVIVNLEELIENKLPIINLGLQTETKLIWDGFKF